MFSSLFFLFLLPLSRLMFFPLFSFTFPFYDLVVLILVSFVFSSFSFLSCLFLPSSRILFLSLFIFLPSPFRHIFLICPFFAIPLIIPFIYLPFLSLYFTSSFILLLLFLLFPLFLIPGSNSCVIIKGIYSMFTCGLRRWQGRYTGDHKRTSSVFINSDSTGRLTHPLFRLAPSFSPFCGFLPSSVTPRRSRGSVLSLLALTLLFVVSRPRFPTLDNRKINLECPIYVIFSFITSSSTCLLSGLSLYILHFLL